MSKRARVVLPRVDPLALEPPATLKKKGTTGVGSSAMVHADESGVWNFMLNQTNIANNNNKYFMGQIIKVGGGKFTVFFKWGRVGAKSPQCQLHHCGSYDAAVATFEKKFHDKSKNHWADRDSFEPVAGKYTLIEVVVASESDEDDEDGGGGGGGGGGGEGGAKGKKSTKKKQKPGKAAAETVACTLDPRVRSLVEKVCSVEIMRAEVSAMGVDLDRLPLGKLSRRQIAKGLAILSQVAAELDAGDSASKAMWVNSDDEDEDEEDDDEDDGGSGGGGGGGGASARARGGGGGGGGGGRRKSTAALRKKSAAGAKSASGQRRALVELSNQFYTHVPVATGMRVTPPVISTRALLKQKLELIELLGNIELANQMMSGGEAGAGAGGEEGGSSGAGLAAAMVPRHPLDEHYEALRAELTPVSALEPDWRMVERYIARTHGPTHGQYTLELTGLTRVARRGEAERFAGCGAGGDPNRMLLWHGSRVSNFMGILSQGLRIAPPEAPVTGYMFGKGLYFADFVTKSANYCHATQAAPDGIMLLCEVALGRPKPMLQADPELTLGRVTQEGFDSVKGCGKFMPGKDADAETWEGMRVPCNSTKPSGVKGSALLYNEFIVYDTARVRIRFACELRHKFKV